MKRSSRIRSAVLEKMSDKNTKSVITNIIGSFGVKGLSMIIGLFTTPVYIRYFNNNEVLGIWFTLLSVLAWILNCDMGIGNGLRNKLVGALESEDKYEGRKYVSSAYLFLCGVSVIVIIVVAIVSRFVNWNVVFNISSEILGKEELGTALTILLLAICLQLIFRLITSVLYALQQAFIPSLLNLITNVFLLFYALITISMEVNGSIINMAWAYLFAVNLPLVAATIIVFLFSHRELAPSLKFYNNKYAFSTLKIGGAFLWIQFMAMILNSTNSYFVTLFVGNAEVVDFNIYNKIFTLIGTFVSLASTPIWSAATKAQVEENYIWLSNLFKRFLSIAVIAIAGEFILVFPLQIVFDIWLGESTIPVNYGIAVVFAIYGSVMIWSSVITCFVNGLGELKLQSIFLTLGAVIDIILTYCLAKATNSYVAIVIANIFAFLPYLIVQTIWLCRYLKKVTRRAHK